ncbi:MAG TPA: hypothetical protein VFS05_13395 [Gemmatimonadaceae bacterium]|nr:hypothetical protein [Gemmatimonadaceae bacterium]
MTTIGEWLAERTPEPPAELAARLRAALADVLHGDAGGTSAACLAAAERELRAYLPRCAAGTDDALDLLTVDALVTYALEAAAGDVDALERSAREAMARFAALAPASA